MLLAVYSLDAGCGTSGCTSLRKREHYPVLCPPDEPFGTNEILVLFFPSSTILCSSSGYLFSNVASLLSAPVVMTASGGSDGSGNNNGSRSKPTPPPKPFPYGMSRITTTTADGASLHMTMDLVHQLRSLRSKTRGLRDEFTSLRKMAIMQSNSTRDVMRETCDTIRTSLSFLDSNDPMEQKLRLDRLRLSRDEESYRHDVRKLEKDLTNLETQVEELRSNVITRRCKVNMTDVESMAHTLSRASKVVADLKLRYPHLQDTLKTVMQQEMEIVVREEK
jgi:hypothetical protein